ncbi:hypothetical protein GO491_08860 [Flavobacteriaceae bacterium Ap0902]|nr:hypothetical protein [Flavobacteriaceae bacterium Ap0902]
MINRIIFILLFISSPSIGIHAQEGNHTGFEETSKEFNILLFNQQFEQAYDLLESESNNIHSVEIENRTQLYLLYSKYYLYIEDLDKGKEYAEKAYNISQKSQSPIAQAYGLYAMAYYYHQLDLVDMAYEKIQQILNLIEVEEHPQLAAKVYYRLYGIFSNWDDPEQTNFYAQKSLEFAKKIKNYELLSNAHAAKATAMTNMYNHTGEKAYQDSIIYFLRKSAKTAPQYADQVALRTKIIANLNLANYFFQALRESNMQNKAAEDSINYYLDIIGNIPPDMDQNYDLRAAVLGMKSQVELANGNLDTTEDYLLTAYQNLRRDGIRPAYYRLFNITIGLYELYKIKDDYQKAFEYLQINQNYKDSIFNENRIQEVHSLEAKYENQRIKEELSYLEQESELRKIQNYLLLGICVLVMGLLYLLRKNYLKRIALQHERAFALEKEKAEAEAQVNLEKEKQARLSAERRILKLENEKMQKEVMVNTLQIKRKNDLLEAFKEELKKIDTPIDATKVLKQEKRLEKSLDDTVNEFGDINPLFFNKLKEQSDNKLTPLDLKYAAYFHLGLSTKEIAQIFNVEPKSIRMTKYRLKQKLNLPKEQTIEEFFEEISKD